MDGGHALPRDQQRTAAYPVWQTGLHNPDFGAFAELCGAKGTRITDPELLAEAVRSAVDHPGPALVEIVADPPLV